MPTLVSELVVEVKRGLWASQVIRQKIDAPHLPVLYIQKQDIDIAHCVNCAHSYGPNIYGITAILRCNTDSLDAVQALRHSPVEHMASLPGRDAFLPWTVRCCACNSVPILYHLPCCVIKYVKMLDKCFDPKVSWALKGLILSKVWDWRGCE